MNGERERARRSRLAAQTCLVLIITCASQALRAQTLDWSVDVGAQHSDNIGRTTANEESETVASAGIAFDVNADRPRLDADIAADVRYRDYLDDAFDNEVVGGLSGLVTYAFLPERFTWVAQDNFGQIANQRQAVETPDNRQNVNYFTTGPDLTLPLGRQTRLLLSGRWSDAYYENTLEDNESLDGSIALIRQLSDTTSLSLNGSVTEVEYDEEAAFAEYEIREAFLRFEATGSRTTFGGDFGYTELRQAGESSDGLLARAEITRRVASRSRVMLQAGTEFSTTADTFRRDQSVGGIEVGNDLAAVSSDAFRTDFAYLIWSTDWQRSLFNATLSTREETHELLTELDREQVDATLTWSRQLSRVLDIDLVGGYLQEEFIESGFKFDEWLAGAGLSWQFSRRFSLRMQLDHLEGSSEDGSRDYEENRVYVGLAYTRGRQAP